MTNPTEHFTPPAAGSCDASQWEISPALDERRPYFPAARSVALVALCALGWWLLDLRVVPAPRTAAVPGNASPALAMNRQLAVLEQPLAREQAALQGATADRFTRVHDVLHWSSLALQ